MATRRKGVERREQILQAAVRTFARYGYQETSIEKICQEVGIARGTLYQYFEDKHTLFREILEDYANRIQAFMQPFTALNLELPQDRKELEKLLATRIQLVFNTIQRDKDIYTILFKEAVAKTTDTADLVRKIGQQFLSLMATEMREAQAMGAVVVDDPEFTANFVLGGIFKTAQEFVFDAEEPRDARELAERIASLVGKVVFKD